MIINADLHIHSHYSKHSNKDMNIHNISIEANKKGLDLVASGDCLHPEWIKEIKKCEYIDEGTYELNKTRFMISTEIEDIDRIHHLIYFCDFSKVEEFKEKISKKSKNIDKVGKPKIEMSGEEIAEAIKDIEGIIGPAHILTPWNGVYSIKKSLYDCYGDLTNYIKFIELGLSTNTDLADRIQELHRLTFLSNSDSHNPHPVRFGREFNQFKVKDKTYSEIKKAICRNNGNKTTLNVGLPPQEGKYFESACIKCFKHFNYNTAKLINWRCSCGEKIKKGVKDQIEEIADFFEPQHPYHRPPYLYTIPLFEIITQSLHQRNPFTDISFKRWNELIVAFGNEINVLFNVSIKDISKITVPAITEAIKTFRRGDYLIRPGGGGKYGQFVFPNEKNEIIISLDKSQQI